MNTPSVDRCAPTVRAVTILLALCCIAFAGFTSSAVAQPTSPPDREPPLPRAIADRAIEQIESQAELTERSLSNLTQRTLAAIEAAESDAIAQRIARRGLGNVQEAARSGLKSIRQTAGRALRNLSGTEADPELLKALAGEVLKAAREANQSVFRDRAEATEAIQDAAGLEGR